MLLRQMQMTLRRLLLGMIFCWVVVPPTWAAELPVVRLAHAAFNEKVAALWLGVEQGFFRKHGVEVQLVYIRTGPQTVAALTSGEIHMIYTIPAVVLNAAAGGMDLAMFAGIVNKAEGDIVVAPTIRTAEELKGKRIGVQSIGGGIWSQTMLALEHFGLEPARDKINIMVIGGDQSVIAQALASGTIDAAYLGYAFSSSLKTKGFRVLIDLGKAAIPYQGLALIGRGRLSEAESPPSGCGFARCARCRRVCSEPGEKRCRGQIVDEKFASLRRARGGERLQRAAVAL
jgi:ABC-type nitrate/sulfonate/bicarbonate transport system substrate-binding protein